MECGKLVINTNTEPKEIKKLKERLRRIYGLLRAIEAHQPINWNDGCLKETFYQAIESANIDKDDEKFNLL